jgi:hypothetical protein
MLDAESAKPRHIIEHGAGVETELRDDLDGKPGRLGGRDLFGKRAVEFVRADARMAIGIAGNADRANAAPAQHAAVDGVESAAERSAFRAIAGNDQRTSHLGFAVEPRQEVVECVSAREIAHCDVRHRLEAGGAQPDRGAEHLLRRAGRDGADVDPRAVPKERERGDIGVGRPRRLDGKIRHESGDALDRGRERVDRLRCERDHPDGSYAVVQSRRREIT